MKEEKNWAAEVRECQEDHWKKKQETQDYILMKKNTAKPVVHVILFIISGGILNLLYWAMRNQQKMILKRA